MGQAKLRGTFEDRKAAAIVRNGKERAARKEILARRPSPKLSYEEMAYLVTCEALDCTTHLYRND
jgi:hypothetical protein